MCVCARARARARVSCVLCVVYVCVHVRALCYVGCARDCACQRGGHIMEHHIRVRHCNPAALDGFILACVHPSCHYTSGCCCLFTLSWRPLLSNIGPCRALPGLALRLKIHADATFWHHSMGEGVVVCPQRQRLRVCTNLTSLVRYG